MRMVRFAFFAGARMIHDLITNPRLATDADKRKVLAEIAGELAAHGEAMRVEQARVKGEKTEPKQPH
jgi:hypothetical protein